MTKIKYETMDIELDQDLEVKMVQSFVDTKFTSQSKSVFDDEVAAGVDIRIAFYNAWRNEEIIKALKWALTKEKAEKAATEETTDSQPELTQEEKDYNVWSEAYHREGGMAGGSW